MGVQVLFLRTALAGRYNINAFRRLLQQTYLIALLTISFMLTCQKEHSDLASRRKWKNDAEGGPGAYFRIQLDVGSVFFEDLPGDAQAQSGSL